MKHLVRAGGLLLAILGIVFVVPRVIPVTESLEGYGFYARSDAQNTQEWANMPVRFVDSWVCSTCHKDTATSWLASSHKTVACENCHGAAATHIENGVALLKDTSRESCAVCHAKVVARPANFPQVDVSAHGGQSSCVTCHNPHSPAAPAAAVKLPAIPHSLDGRADCLLCHNNGGLRPFPASHSGRDAATCLSCHKGK